MYMKKFRSPYIPHTHPRNTFQKGFSMLESVLGIGLFVMITFSIYTTWTRMFETIHASQSRVVASELANEQFEIIRNIPFAQVGTVSGIPSGVLPSTQTFTRSGLTFMTTTTVRNIDQPFDGTIGGSPDDLSPADNKLVELEVMCTSCKNFRPTIFSTWVAPKDLEGASTNGALFVRVMDSGGLPIQGADVHVVNTSLVPAVSVYDITSTSGMLQIIDAPPSVMSYQVSVSKSGYSSDQTYGAPTTTNPVLPHSTVAVQTVTQVTLSIDRLSTIHFSSVTPSCSVVPNVGVSMRGTKLISTTPDVYKHDDWFSTGAGTLTRNDIEWDNYLITASSGTHDLAGVMPLSPVSVTPGSVQDIQLILSPRAAKSAMVTVKDAGTGLPISGASVTLDLSGASSTLLTGRGFLHQTEWSGGSGQSLYTDETRYASDDTHMDVTSVPGTVRLLDSFGSFAPSGTLESSTFDTGSASNFYQLTFLPQTQPAETGDSVKFQIATSNSTSSWVYLGPDGTAGTYYTATTSDINAIHNGDRYFRYKMFLSTASSTLTPSVSDVMFTFTSSCTPPGQVLFQSLVNGTYDVTVSKTGYSTFVDTMTIDASTPWQEKQVTLTP